MILKEIFRMYDIRGIVPETLKVSDAQTISNIFGLMSKEELGGKNPVICVGRDMRLTSEEMFTAVSQGLSDSGCDVIELGICPSPATYFAMKTLDTDGFIMITGSHNPKGYNGLKLGTRKGIYHSEKITSIYDRILKLGYFDSTAKGKINLNYIRNNYLDWLTDHFSALKKKISGLDKKIKVVIDCGSGAASRFAPEMFKRMGIETIEIFCEEDGRFPGHHPDPTVEENLRWAKEEIEKNSADFAVAYDGDADRIGLVCENGQVIWGDTLLGIFAGDIIKEYPNPTVIGDVKGSKALYDYLDEIGANGIMWKSGHSMIKTKMQQEKALLAGEMSAHIFFADRYFGYDDAIYASLRFLEIYVGGIVSGELNKVSDMLKPFKKMHNTPEIRVECPEKYKFKAIAKINEIFNEYLQDSKYGIKKIIDIDGIRINFEHGWGLIRASNTQPVTVMRFEADSEEEMLKYKKLVTEKYEEVLKSFGL